MFTLQAPHVRHTDSRSRSAGTDKRQRTLGRSEPSVLSDFKLGHRVLQVGVHYPCFATAVTAVTAFFLCNCPRSYLIGLHNLSPYQVSRNLF